MAVTKRTASSSKKLVTPAKATSSHMTPTIAKRKRSSHSTTTVASKTITANLHNEHKSVEQAAEDFALAEIIGLSAFTESIGTFSSTFSQINNVVRKNSSRALRNNRQSYHRFWASDQRNMHDFMSVSADCAINSYDTLTDIMKDIGILIRKSRTRITEPYSTRMKLYHDLIEGDADMQENTSGPQRNR